MKKALPFNLSASDYSPTMPALPRVLASVRAVIPLRVRRKWRATRTRIRTSAATTNSISTLQTSFSPADTIKSLQQHQWSLYDAQYLFLVLLGIFCLSIMEFPGAIVKTLAATLLLFSLLVPVTRQFFFACVPLFGWLILFYSCK